MRSIGLLAAVTLSLMLAAGTASAQDEEETGTASSSICCGASCCLISGLCRSRGQTNPSNSCQTCDPSMSQTAWTTTPGCTPPTRDAGSGGGGGGSGGCAAGGGARGGVGPLALGFAAACALALGRRRR